MAFDLNSAKPVEDTSAGFDISSAKPVEEDPLKKKKTTLGQDLKIGAANAVNLFDTFSTNLIGAVKSLYDTDAADKEYDELNKRIKFREQKFNPDRQEQGVVGKMVSGIPGMVAFPMAPATSGKVALDAGESLSDAVKATVIDTLGNMAAVALPPVVGKTIPGKVGSGIGIGAGQDVLTKLAIQSQMKTEQGKAAFDPTFEDALAAGMSAGMLAPFIKNPNQPNITAEQERLKRIQEAQAKLEAERKAAEPPGPIDWETPDIPGLALADSPTRRDDGLDFTRDQADALLSQRLSPEQRAEVIKRGFDPRQPAFEANRAAEEQARLDLQDWAKQFPEDQLEMLRNDPQLAEQAFARFEREQQIQKQGQMEAMWNEREQSIEQRATDRIAREDNEQSLLDLQDQLSVPRVSKGQQRKANQRVVNRGQRGAASPEFLATIATLGMYPVLSKLAVRLRSLEHRLTLEGIRQSVNQQDTPLPEKEMILRATTYSADEKGKIDPEKLATNLNMELGKQELTIAPNKEYATYGLNNIGWIDDTGNNQHPFRSAATMVFRLPFEVSAENHFRDPNYFGHTRVFQPDDKSLYVVEIQSDLAQRLNSKPIESTAPLSAALKVWPQRLIRETLAAVARKGSEGKTVYFATADTMAKVEGWPDYHQDLDRAIAEVTKELSNYESAKKDPIFDSTFIENQINILKSELEGLTKSRLTTPRFSSNQGIYDRHKKVVESFVKELGGTEHTDDKGNTWLAVEVKPQFANPVLYGAKGKMKNTQMGAVDFDLLTLGVFKKSKPFSKDVKDAMIPDDPVPEDVLLAAQGEKDIAWNWTRLTESGGTGAAMNRRSTLVQGASEFVQNAGKRADYNIRNIVLPLEDVTRNLSNAEIYTVSKLLLAQSMAKDGFDPQVLKDNLSADQLIAMERFKAMTDLAFEKQNKALQEMGEAPMTKEEYYASSRWQGEFRLPVRDKNGKLVWYLAANTKWGLKRQLAKLQERYPEYTADLKDIHSPGNMGGADAVLAYRTAKRILGENDPAVKALAEYVENTVMKDSMEALAQSKHFETKTGVRGFVGDRFWKDQEKEAVEFMRQQITYAKNGFKWAELQTAGEKIKKLISDEAMNLNQPNNVEYIRDYYKANIGQGEAKITRALNNAIRDMGFSPNSISSGIGGIKTFFILQKLAGSLPYMAANAIQLTWIAPYLADMRAKGYKGNPMTAMAMGVYMGFPVAAGHWAKVLGAEINNPMGAFYKEAIQYAEDNGITSRSSYDESPIGRRDNLALRGVDAAAKVSMAVPESYVRSAAFMAYVQMLKDSGKFTDNIKLFQKAEEYVNKSMVDYREGERPLMFAKMGFMGNLANTLQTFPVSYYNQWRYMIKEASRGNVMPAIFAAALQYGLAGVMGMPGVQDLDTLYQKFKQFVASTKPEIWAKIKDHEFLRDPKVWLLKNGGETALSGWLSEFTDTAMSSRLGAPVLGDMATSAIGPMSDLAGQAGNVLSAAIDPTNPTKLAQVAMSSAPVGLQGIVEQKAIPRYTGNQQADGTRDVFKSTDLASRDKVYERNEWDQEIRNWGFRSNREAVTKDLEYRDRFNAQLSRDAATKISQRFYTAMVTGNKEKMKEAQQTYVSLTGRPITREVLRRHFKDEFQTEFEQLKSTQRTVEAVKRVKQMNEALNAINN
jgi:hypothetical protein